MEEFLSNPLLLLVLGYFLARWDKRGDQQIGGEVSFSALKASIEEKFRSVFQRLDVLDDSRAKHDERISDLVNQVHELVARLDVLIGIGRSEAMRHKQRGIAV
jgi:hypothetical protein